MTMLQSMLVIALVMVVISGGAYALAELIFRGVTRDRGGW